jgi:hypothetical protein
LESCLDDAMHRMHREWASENALRRDQLRIWQYELYQLKCDLPRLQAAIDCHERALAEHATHVRLYDLTLSEQEHVIAASRTKQPCGDQPPLSSRAPVEESEHLKQSDRHELLKQHHVEVMKHWLSLMKALSKCDVPGQG